MIRNALDEIKEANRPRMEDLVGGVLEGLEPINLKNTLERFQKASSKETFLKILLLSPFGLENLGVRKQAGKRRKTSVLEGSYTSSTNQRPP